MCLCSDLYVVQIIHNRLLCYRKTTIMFIIQIHFFNIQKWSGYPSLIFQPNMCIIIWKHSVYILETHLLNPKFNGTVPLRNEKVQCRLLVSMYKVQNVLLRLLRTCTECMMLVIMFYWIVDCVIFPRWTHFHL